MVLSLHDEIDPNAIVWYWFREKDCERAPDNADFSIRPLGILRPARDVAILPDAPLFRDAWAFFQLHRPDLQPWQAVFLNCATLEDDASTHESALAAISEIQHHLIPRGTGSLTISPYLVTDALKTVCKACSLNIKIFGDDVVGAIDKAMLHPAPTASATFAFVPGVRTPKGFSCVNKAELERAYKLLCGAGVRRAVFKPTFTQGGIDASQADIDALPIAEILSQLGENAEAYGYTASSSIFMLEEYIDTEPGMPSPAAFCLNSQVLPVCDQIIGAASFVHGGNEFPSTLPSPLVKKCRAAMTALRDEWSHLKGFWGVDFVIDRHTQEPVLVDLNMSRPNGNHPALIHASTLPWNASRKWKFLKVRCPDVPACVAAGVLDHSGLLYTPELDHGMCFLSYARGKSARAFFCGQTRADVDRAIAGYEALLERMDAEHQPGERKLPAVDTSYETGGAGSPNSICASGVGLTFFALGNPFMDKISHTAVTGAAGERLVRELEKIACAADEGGAPRALAAASS